MTMHSKQPIFISTIGRSLVPIKAMEAGNGGGK